MVDVEDVVDHLLLLGERPEAVGEAFFASSEETTTVEAMQQLIARHMGWKTRTVTLPPFALLGLARVADAVSNATGKHLPWNRKLAKQLLAPRWTCSIEKSKRLLGYRPRVSIEASIVRSADWYREQGLI